MYDGYVDFILDLCARPCPRMGLPEERLWNAISPTITHRGLTPRAEVIAGLWPP
jgi:hypothetical protein